MLVGVMSDSHDNLPLIRAALDRLQQEGVEVLMHAGDFVAPFAVRALLKFPHRVLGVFGNNDGERRGIRALWPEVCMPPRHVRLADRNIVIVHDRAGLDPAELGGADVLIHGHTHNAEIRREGTLLAINPGECGAWVTGKATVVVLDTSNLEARILALPAAGG